MGSLHGVNQDCEQSVIAALSNVEAHETACSPGQAEGITRRKDDILCQCMAGNICSIKPIRQFTP